jgi:hypothetical protein
VDDLHVSDHTVLLDLSLAGLLRGIVDADALATLRGATGGGRL